HTHGDGACREQQQNQRADHKEAKVGQEPGSSDRGRRHVDAVRREIKRLLSLRDALRSWIVRVGATLDGEHVIAFRERYDRPEITIFVFGHSVSAAAELGVKKRLKVLA